MEAFRSSSTQNSSDLRLHVGVEFVARAFIVFITYEAVMPVSRSYLCHLALYHLAAIALPVAFANAAAADWGTYRNERYGVSLEYPRDLFTAERTTEAGDGQSFLNQESGARLLVGVLPNGSDFTPQSYQNYLAGHTYQGFEIKYRKTGRSWMALSGSNSESIFYEKVIFSCGGRVLSSFVMTYPAARRDAYDIAVERAEKTFRGTTTCPKGDQVTEKAGKRQTLRSTHQSSRHQVLPGTRSALADGIARQRGTDVIVILRSTTPPYDRKVVHGYASSR